MHHNTSRLPTGEDLPPSLRGALFERQDKVRAAIARMIAEHRRGNFAENGAINIERLTANVGFRPHDHEVAAILAEIHSETAKVCSPS